MYRIALIEDDPPTSDTFKKWLSYRFPSSSIEQYFDFEGAADAISRAEFDLVVSDVDLGKPSDKYGGVKVAKLLHGKQIPILIVSGLPQPDLHRDIAFALDAWDYLQKPVTESDFLNQASRALQWRQDRLSNKTNSPSVGTTRDPNLVLEPLGRAKALWRDKRVHLSMTHLRIVSALNGSLNQPVSYDVLLDLLESGRNKDNLRVHIQTIRRSFEDIDSTFSRISNVPMVGYIWRL